MAFGFRSHRGPTVAERRAAPRVELKRGMAKIDSKTFAVKNLSTRGFVLDAYEGDLVAHQRVYLTLVLAVDGHERDFATDAVVVRTDQRTLAARFNDLRRDARRAIEQYLVPRPARPTT